MPAYPIIVIQQFPFMAFGSSKPEFFPVIVIQLARKYRFMKLIMTKRIRVANSPPDYLLNLLPQLTGNNGFMHPVINFILSVMRDLSEVNRISQHTLHGVFLKWFATPRTLAVLGNPFFGMYPLFI